MQTINRYMVMRFSKVYATLFVAIVLMLSMASCHKDSVMLNPLASFDIELQKVSDGIASKSAVTDFEAAVSVAYEDDTVVYNCRFVASDSISDLYMYDYAKSDVVYATLGKPFRLLVYATVGDMVFQGESEIYVLDGEPLKVSIGLESIFGYIDLGLPSGRLWAKCNLGASSPEEYGSYFAWGETTDKTTYSWSTYTHYKDSGLSRKKRPGILVSC